MRALRHLQLFYDLRWHADADLVRGGKPLSRRHALASVDDHDSHPKLAHEDGERHCNLARANDHHGFRRRQKLEEEHDIVYRDAPPADARPQRPQLAPEGETWSRTIDADAVMLFRYSALTFNSHRIHYDQPYATQVEGYPGLVVHGPLIATLLADLVRREQPEATLQSFAYKALRPTFAGQPLKVCGTPSTDGKTVELWAKDHEGFLTMRATAAIG